MGMFTRDSSGIDAILKSDGVARKIKELADRIATDVRSGTPRPVIVDQHVTDRAIATVTVADPAGAASEAKHGALLAAALSAGLEVKPR